MYAVGDSDEAGALLATAIDKSRQVIANHAKTWLSWRTIADQLAEVYAQAARS
jgi:hypothetical protein